MLTIDMLTGAVAQCGDIFDSHDVIRILMRDNPCDYVRHLYAQLHTQDPIQQGNALIGRMMSEKAGNLRIQKTTKVGSPNLRNPDATQNQQWKKI